jgi:hypothetical protein
MADSYLHAEFDQVFEHFIDDCEVLGEAKAIEIARERLRRLNMSNTEINQHLVEALS